ncbi:nuclear transport factor 2 family protein [Flagellimonas lutaonensis]|uniref:DUF4440 domain-containing protein n=1 Tax=Flagellimonas lutaonensis TaxID=516051 RepID=A0A0D5YNT2_9FLAO|nr:nuclear transport factor 2 family protein [Allomuricauda lutaonensis]AKA33887.1 hypothetical protein VC82_198 [Allomuricauda lutaonensis]
MKLPGRNNMLLLGLTISLTASAQVSQESELYKTIVELDNTYFTAYNECDMATQAAMYSEDLEFYHDMGGLNTSKEQIIKSIEKNICGKVTRELVEGSVEVHEIPGFGAIEIGMHKFYNNQEPNVASKASKFITVWKNEDSNWKISRVISLHKN